MTPPVQIAQTVKVEWHAAEEDLTGICNGSGQTTIFKLFIYIATKPINMNPIPKILKPLAQLGNETGITGTSTQSFRHLFNIHTKIGIRVFNMTKKVLNLVG
ncbi:uncharacterized protein BcabD6B2_42970 [Babesia caballi]|uniref:Uncharacterized protein n=1 Tax=Babesia caballi TaxID=5871 RepID=A0AAV4LYG6_BABCB|nr:hypothetical protein BcabD6B2_42970 [Babesia caballi]